MGGWLTPLLHRAIAAYRRRLFRPNPLTPERGLAYADAANVPQEMQFAIDCLPTLAEILQGYGRDRTVRLLDFGPGFGAGSNLLATLFRSDFLWCRVRVEALDVKDLRRDLAAFDYPLINYRVGDLDALRPEEKWDIVYCSNVIEHTEEPAELIAKLRARARDWLIVYAPYDERELSPGHRVTVTEGLFEPFVPVKIDIKRSLAWSATPQHRQILALLRGAG